MRSMAVATISSGTKTVRSMAVATIYTNIVVGKAMRSISVATVYSSGTGRAVHGCSYNI